MLKRLAAFLLSLVLGLGSWFKTPPVTLQQKSSHMAGFLDKDGEVDGICTASAIGPHAILTGDHCNPEDMSEQIRIDLSPVKYNILANAHDGQEHVIYLLDGPAFTNYLRIDEISNTRSARAGEKVFIYGFGHGYYPAARKSGQVDGQATLADVSDVDQAMHVLWCKLPVIPGDSGSAIFAEDGKVLGLVTYGSNARKVAIGFSLSFRDRVIREAATFSIEGLEDGSWLNPLRVQ